MDNIRNIFLQNAERVYINKITIDLETYIQTLSFMCNVRTSKVSFYVKTWD